jgi:hypothetical protein
VQLLDNARRTYLFVLSLGGLCTGLGGVNFLAEKGESLIVSPASIEVTLPGNSPMASKP